MNENGIKGEMYFRINESGDIATFDHEFGAASPLPFLPTSTTSDSIGIAPKFDGGLFDKVCGSYSGKCYFNLGAGESNFAVSSVEFDYHSSLARGKSEGTIDPPKEMDANTYLYDDGVGHLCVANYKNGKYQGRTIVLPSIVDVKVIDNIVVIVSFADGTEEKAVTHKNDTFNIEQGISVCIAKKLLSKYSFGNTAAVYNKVIKYCVKVNKKNRDSEAKERARAAEEKARAKRRYDKVVAKKKRKAEARRKQNIDDMTQAFVSAAKIIDGMSSGNNPMEDDLK